MSLLHGTTTIFIEFEGMLYDTDTYVVNEVFNYMVSHKDEKNPFDGLYDMVDLVSPRNVKYLLQTKETLNPLMGYLTEGFECDEESDLDLEDIADITYTTTLYNFKYTDEDRDDVDDEGNPIINTLRLTSIGAGLKGLVNDKNIKNLFIYSRQPLSEDMLKLLYEDFGDPACIKLIVGDKKKAMLQNLSDVYFLNSISDMYNIVEQGKRYENEIQVVVPTFSFNMMDEDEDIELLVNLKENAIVTKSKYNIEVCTTNIPIV